jgi:hypothetical protein
MRKKAREAASHGSSGAHWGAAPDANDHFALTIEGTSTGVDIENGLNMHFVEGRFEGVTSGLFPESSNCSSISGFLDSPRILNVTPPVKNTCGNFEVRGTHSNRAEYLGTPTITSGSGSYTFATAWQAAPLCVGANRSNKNAFTLSATTTTLFVPGTGSEIIACFCQGNPN